MDYERKKMLSKEQIGLVLFHSSSELICIFQPHSMHCAWHDDELAPSQPHKLGDLVVSTSTIVAGLMQKEVFFQQELCLRCITEITEQVFLRLTMGLTVGGY